MHTTPRRHIYLSTRNFFATIATYCNNMPLQVKNTTIVHVFCPHSHTETDLSGNTCFLQQVQKVMSESCNWLISINVVYFVFWCILYLTTNFLECIVIFLWSDWSTLLTTKVEYQWFASFKVIICSRYLSNHRGGCKGGVRIPQYRTW